ncbi:hypothetical protein ACSBR1_016512 [Camellia fascicularis]
MLLLLSRSHVNKLDFMAIEKKVFLYQNNFGSSTSVADSGSLQITQPQNQIQVDIDAFI